jgi:hypothetical protein
MVESIHKDQERVRHYSRYLIIFVIFMRLYSSTHPFLRISQLKAPTYISCYSGMLRKDTRDNDTDL